MALSTPSESPAVVVKEIDLTGGVPNVQSTTGATVIQSTWGPVEQRVKLSTEQQLVDVFGAPDSATTLSFHRANFFLKYSNSLQTVRVIDTNAKNAVSTTGQTAAASPPAEVIKNLADFNSQLSGLDSDLHTFIAKYPGTLGNSLQVSLCPYSAGDSAFETWAYKNEFDAAPGTSDFATKNNATNDEVHVAIIDKGGKFTGTQGTLLERYAFVSLGSNAKNADGTTNYIKDIINTRSDFVWQVDFDSDFLNTLGDKAAAGTAIDSGDNFAKTTGTLNTDIDYNFAGGVNVSSLTTGNILAGFDLFEDKDQVEIDFLISPVFPSRTDQTTVVNDLVTTAQSLRKDCVVVASPARSDVINVNNADTAVANIVATANTFTKSSYLVMDGNYLKVYDKYNDQFIDIPANSSTAGIMAATDLNRAPWFSPAGSRRGQYLGITSLAFTPTKPQRDTLYKAGVNPIANIPGAGVILFGDKTMLARPSAFDRINVRRLFLVLERAISRAAEQVLFEFNDEFTRAEFVNIVEPVLREVKGRRGITDFRVVADETNNTPAVIDRNEFIASIFIKPARSINYVTLNFVAVRTGVDFEEVVGTV